MKKYVKTINVYDMPNGFTVEVDSVDSTREFYLHHKDYGDKMYMFGLPSIEEASEEGIIETNAAMYISVYKEKLEIGC